MNRKLTSEQKVAHDITPSGFLSYEWCDILIRATT